MMFPLMPRTPVRWLKTFAFICLTVALTACGGGGGSGSSGDSSSRSSVSSVSSSNSSSEPDGASSSSSNQNSSSSSVADTTPEPFSFAPVSDAEPGGVYVSNTVEIKGIAVPVAVTIEGGEYAIGKGSDDFTTGAGQVSEGNKLTLRAAAPSEGAASKVVTVTVGSVSATFEIRTKDDTSADAFSFTAKDDAEPGEDYTSNTVTITGISVSVPVSVTGGQYSLDGGTSFTGDSGHIQPGQTLILRGTASDQTSTAHEVNVTIGEGEAAQSATFVITTLNDETPPEAAITFPPPMSAFDPAYGESSTLRIRGTAEDDYNAVDSVTVTLNGNPVTDIDTDDDFANWTATVTLAPGENVIRVKAMDSEGNDMPDDHAAEITVHQQAFDLPFPDDEVPIQYARAMTFDVVGNRALISNSHTFTGGGNVEQIVVVDMETGQRGILSSEGEPDDDHAVGAVTGMVVDAVRGRILASSVSDDAIYTIDLETGHQQVLSSSTIPDSEQPELNSPTGIAIDPTNPDVAYVIANQSDNLSRLNLVTGERALISDNTMSESGPAFNSPEGLVIDSENNRALVTDVYGETLFAVDLATGVRTVISTSDEEGVFYPIDITTDDIANRVLVTHPGEGLVSVDLDSGDWTQLHPRLGGSWQYVHYVSESPYVLWLDRTTQGLYAFDLESRTLVTVSKSVDEP